MWTELSVVIYWQLVWGAVTWASRVVVTCCWEIFSVKYCGIFMGFECSVGLWCVVLGCAVLCWVILCCDVSCWVVLCCVVLCCVLLLWVGQCCVVLCLVVYKGVLFYKLPGSVFRMEAFKGETIFSMYFSHPLFHFIVLKACSRYVIVISRSLWSKSWHITKRKFGRRCSKNEKLLTGTISYPSSGLFVFILGERGKATAGRKVTLAVRFCCDCT